MSNDRIGFLGNLSSRYTPVDWVSLEAGVSYDRADRATKAVYDSGFLASEEIPGNGGFQDTFDVLGEALNYNVSATFSSALGDVALRSRWQYDHEDFQEASEYSFGPLLGESLIDVSAGSSVDEIVDRLSRKVLTDGFLGTLGFDINGKLLLDGLYRIEGSSLFGEEERWQNYYRLSGAYRVSQESWWPVSVLPEFKVHASYGIAGGRPRFEAQYQTYGLQDDTVVKLILGNKVLKPELTTELELGSSLIAFDRFFIDVAYASSETEDLLLLMPLPGFFGFQSQWQNGGALESQTIEASLFAHLIRNRNTRLNIGVVFDRTRQKITGLLGDGFSGGPHNVFYFEAGESLGAIYGSKFVTSFDDLSSSADHSFFDINDDGYAVPVGQDNSYRDGFARQLWGTTVVVDGTSYAWGMPVKKGANDESDFTRIGNALPDFNLGIPINFRYKGFRAGVLWHAQVGGDVYNFSNQSVYRTGRAKDQDQAGKLDEYKKPALYHEVLQDGNRINSHFVEDGTFVKLRELSLGYTFDSAQLSNLFGGVLHSLTISATGRNILTFTKYSGLDPEAASSFGLQGNVGNDATLYRLDNFAYPNYRTITGKLEIQF